MLRATKNTKLQCTKVAGRRTGNKRATNKKINKTIQSQSLQSNLSTASPTTTSTSTFATRTKKTKVKLHHKDVTLDSLTMGVLPTPKSILIGEELQDEEAKQLKDSKSPLRNATMNGYSIDLPQMSKIYAPTAININAINDELRKNKVDEKYMLKHPSESIPNWSKLTKTEQLLLQSGYISLVPGSSNYTYLPMAMRVMDKLIDMIADELVTGGSQKVELPSIVEKALLDEFQLYRQRMVKENESIHNNKEDKVHKKVENKDNNKDANEDDDGSENTLSQSPYDHPLSPYYRFYNLKDEELVVSPPLLDYYTSLVKNQVKLANQLPLSFHQFSKKLRDINDENALLNASTNISEANQTIGYMDINNDKKNDDTNNATGDSTRLNADGIPHHPAFSDPNGKSHQTSTLLNGLITSTEYHAMNSVSFHHDANDAHLQYKSTLEMFNRLFRKLGVQGVQVEADGGRLGAELSHEYHLVIGATSEAPKINTRHDVNKKGSNNKNNATPTVQANTHALVQCGLCNYTANTENAQFAVSEQFDQSTYNQRMKTGDLTRAMRQDPRSFGIFEPTGGDPQFDRDIRSKVTGLVKQMLPNLARRDVPMVANVVKLIYAPGQDGFYDVDKNSDEFTKDQLQFINHSVIMLRADREFNPRAIARHFGCYEVELLSSAESALLLLKFQKFKQKQYQELIRAGIVEAFDPNFNIFSELLNKALPVSAKDIDKMYEDMNDMTLIEKEQRRLRRLAARRDVNAGLTIVCDNTLTASGIDLDDEEMMDEKFLEEQNQDRSFGLKMADSGKAQGKHLMERLDGYKTAGDFQATQHVPPEFAEQFEIIFKGIKEGLITVTKEGDIILNDIPEGLEGKYPEFMGLPQDASLDEFKTMLLKQNEQGELVSELEDGVDDNIIDAELVDENGKTISVVKNKRKVSFTRQELEESRADFLRDGIDIDEHNTSDFENVTADDIDDIDEITEGDNPDDDDGFGYEGRVLPILQDEDAKDKTPQEIFESAMQDTKAFRKERFENTQGVVDDETQIAQQNNNKAAAKSGKYNKLRTKDDEGVQHEEAEEEDQQINMYTNEYGDMVDEKGQILPHITSDLTASPDVRRAFGKSGYDQLGDDDEFADNQAAMNEKLLSTINPSQGDFTAPQTGDRCIQSACQAQGMLEGLRSIEIGKLFYLSDSITRNTDAIVINNRPNKQGVVSLKKEPMHLTSTKIGISRLMHALVESGQFDEHGIVWPELIAPYHISFISDPAVAVNFKRTNRKLLDAQGRSYHKHLDTYDHYLHQAQLAEEEYQNEIESQSRRLKQLKSTPGITPSLDKQRNLLIQDAQELLDTSLGATTKLRFGYWEWGLADNNAHTLNLASTLVGATPSLEDDIVYDDRHHLSINQRVQDAFGMGIPWVVVVDELMQEKGLVKVINRASKYIEHLSIDQVVHFFNGQRPLHQRPEHQGTDFERQMKYKVENALMAHFGKKSAHGGDADFFKIEANNEAFDYNTHVDLGTKHDEEYEEMSTPRFDEDGNVVNLPDSLKNDQDETKQALEAQDEATRTGDVSQAKLDTADRNTKSELVDATIEDAIKSLNARGGDDAGDNKTDADGEKKPQKKGKAVDEWYHTLKTLRRRLPPPTTDELDRMFRVGILYKDQKGQVQVNVHRAESNMHVVYGVDEHVVDQFERGNVLELDSTGKGVKQIIDKEEYLQQQRRFTAQRIEKQLESGFFDLALSPESRAKQADAKRHYDEWDKKNQRELARQSVFTQVNYADTEYASDLQFPEKRRESLQKNGVVFRKISDGSAIVHRPGHQPEQRPFDVRYDILDPTKKDMNPIIPPQAPMPGSARVDVQAVPSRKKKSISDIFTAAPIQQPREGAEYEAVFGKNDYIKDTYGEDAYKSIFGNKNAK